SAPPQGKSSQLAFSLFRFVLRQPQAAEVKTRLGQIRIEGQSALVGSFGFGGVPGVVARQSEVIICLRVGAAEQDHGRLQFLDCGLILPSLNQTLAFEQRTNSGRAAGGKERDRGEKKGNAFPRLIFDGQHQQWWYHPRFEVSRNAPFSTRVTQSFTS